MPLFFLKMSSTIYNFILFEECTLRFVRIIQYIIYTVCMYVCVCVCIISIMSDSVQLLGQ